MDDLHDLQMMASGAYGCDAADVRTHAETKLFMQLVFPASKPVKLGRYYEFIDLPKQRCDDEDQRMF